MHYCITEPATLSDHIGLHYALQSPDVEWRISAARLVTPSFLVTNISSLFQTVLLHLA